MGILSVPFLYSGVVEIECDEVEWDSVTDTTELEERCFDQISDLHDIVRSELDFDGFDFTSADFEP